MARKSAEPESGSIQGYFRKIYLENPKLLLQRSNDVVFERWLADHPGEKEVPQRVKQNLSNLKTMMRKKLKKRGRKRSAERLAAANGAPVAVRKLSGLDRLEAQIDDALQSARSYADEGLADVVKLLRSARNRVILRLEA